MPSRIQVRGPHQFRVQVRLNGVYQTKTFETLKDAREWQRIIEGKVTGEDFVDQKISRGTTLAQACDWMIGNNLTGSGPNAKNLASKLNYWKSSKFGSWSLVSIHDWDLIEWRREVLDEANAKDGELCGPAADGGPHTAIHRLNALSKLIQTWARAHRVRADDDIYSRNQIELNILYGAKILDNQIADVHLILTIVALQVPEMAFWPRRDAINSGNIRYPNVQCG